MDRRSFVAVALAVSLGLVSASRAEEAPAGAAAAERFEKLEAGLGGRLGVFAIDVVTGRTLGHRGDERFPMCSTFKVVLAGAVLERNEREPGLLERRIAYAAGDLVAWSPITGEHVGEGMTVAGLCAAALQHSDNTAANLLMAVLAEGGEADGPAAVTAFARRIGDETFRLDRWETELNTAVPGDERDTTTPRAMAATLQRLLLGDALSDASRGQLRSWMLGNTTGAARIRAGVPAGWRVADKTGTGDYASASDVGLLLPPSGGPIVLAIYTTREAQDAEPRNDVIAGAAKVVAGVFSHR